MDARPADSPPLQARLRASAADFVVEEQMGFLPSGEGEHLWLWIEKRGANTTWVAAQLARWAGVAPMAVGFSGMKDRHAVTRQWFGIHLPRRVAPDSGPVIDGVEVLDRAWHGRKLKRGTHQANRFELVLRDVRGDRDAAVARLREIAQAGVPNAFGEQRFGHGGGNVASAREWLSAPRPGRRPPAVRSLLLSSARAHLFNAVLAERRQRGDWDRGIAGDCFQLDGRGSWFGPEATIDDTLAGRIARGEIHPTGPLWGRGAPPTAADAAAIESAVAARESGLCAGLAHFDLRQERRALRVLPRDLKWQWSPDDASEAWLQLSFALPRGSFATAVVAAFCDATDAMRPDAAAPEEAAAPD